MSSAKNVANAVGGKTARACDSCITKRARWYCAADDAFLCQACDSSVHSANPLARRHERVRLKTASFKSAEEQPNCAPSWHTKKARTPRHGKHSRNNNHHHFHLVPEVGSDEVNSHEENEEQLLYRVPIFDPFVGELCSTSPPSSVAESESKGTKGSMTMSLSNVVLLGCENHEMEGLHGLLPSEVELAEFAADVESLLGRGLENECVGMEELGLVDAKEECSVGSGKVKVEEEEGPAQVASRTCKVEADEVEMVGRDQSFEFSFDYDSLETCEDGKEKVGGFELGNVDGELKEEGEAKRKRISLQLDYDAVIIAWASHKSPWTTGHKPNLDPDQCWPECMAMLCD
ncbi:zinc finger protein CONSTANS-LIKE 16-like isoform X2 [Abrus precatorius]|uniref:Zinc finger protein CONSTANS-LIKE 16-like isoform X2 n=1 Tax=Abrus precatorius TaxID=3816 RepID=A0A8B8MEB8_ABRPR|nr:zinc finger protein CONSTANS-LIKE 16-like isoform X2 [Abrus precatorius]